MSPRALDARTDASASPVRRRRVQDRPVGERLAVDIREAADSIGVSYNTLWRAIHEDQFPALKIRDRIVVPLRAIDMIIEAACASGKLLDAAAWTREWVAGTPADAAAG